MRAVFLLNPGLVVLGGGCVAERTFVGFGFGPIQSGLFLFEAFRSGNFGRLVVSEIMPELVEAVRANGGRYTVNVAWPDRIEAVTVEGVELLNPTVDADRAAIIEAIGQADEMATAVPNIRLYDAGGEASIVSLLADGCQAPRARVLYAAENNNYAAEALSEAIGARAPDFPFDRTAILNTVVGKMSGAATEPVEMARLGLAPMVAGGDRAVLVEQFNRILVSQITVDGCARGIEVFQEKPDLLPFEEAKLYGHNAIHAMLGYLGAAAGCTHMPQLRDHEQLMQLGRQAFLQESGVPLCGKYAKLGDPLFTPQGYQDYADDLLARMTNPFLNDAIERVARDPERKLGYSDRLFGTMRLALDHDVQPAHLAAGAAAGVFYWLSEHDRTAAKQPDPGQVGAILGEIWQDEPRDRHESDLVRLAAEAMPTVWALAQRSHS
jgi:mannitol-1-phosphate 5-dehydrogenase